jgi:demethylmenaquinone methyltransferase/2-methoxy-6-polyprenyl-1,4-benzoquinol methylase
VTDHGLLPEPVRLAAERAERAGFALSCDPGTGRLLAVLAAAVPANGRVLELGTGTGVGTAWITDGLRGRDDVEVVTIEIDTATAARAAQYAWPSWVRLLTGDAMDVTRDAGRFDLIFADAQGGKWEGLDVTVAALRPGAHLLVDDMTPGEFADEHHARKTSEVRARLLGHPDLVSVEIAWSSGLILSTRRSPPRHPAAPSARRPAPQ